MKMKKLAAVALAVVMSVSMLAGCGSSYSKDSKRWCVNNGNECDIPTI